MDSSFEKRKFLDSESAKLPEEIIVEILLKLPVKTLLRFKCVCKSWKSIISDAFFIKRHLDHMSSANNDLYHHFLFPTERRTHPQAISIHYLANPGKNGNGGSTIKPKRLVLRMDKKVFASFRFVGSCNGLVLSDCFGKKYPRKYTLFLWNPSTRQTKILPNSGQSICKGCATNRGFGYDNLSNDYKVVEICFDFQHRCQGQVWVYSLRANSWRRIQDAPYELDGLRQATLICDNFLVWFGRKKGTLVSFDLSNETFQELTSPHDEHATADHGIVSLNGLLSISYVSSQAVQVWVMKQYGVKESWSKLFSLPFPQDAVEVLPDKCVVPLCMLRNCEMIVMVCPKGVVFYRLVDGIYTYRGMVFSSSYMFPSQIYVESLVPVNVE